MSKSAHESSCSIHSLKMRFWMIFKLTGLKNMDFSDLRVAHKVWRILGAPIWAPKSPKFQFHKLQKKLKIFQFYHVYSKSTSFDVQPQIAKCNQIPYYVMSMEIFKKNVVIFWLLDLYGYENFQKRCCCFLAIRLTGWVLVSITSLMT